MRSQFKKLSRESDVCVLCGRREAVTGEHIPPRSLFRENANPYLTVPACKECNEGTKLDDEYLEQSMSATSLIGEGRRVWNEKVAPKFRDLPKTRAGLRNSMAIGEVETRDFGKFIAPQFGISAPRLMVSITKMVSGLHWFHTGHILPAARKPIITVIDTARGAATFESDAFKAFYEDMSLGVYQDPTTMETFFYSYYVSTSGLASKWLFYFYKQTVVPAVSHPPRRKRVR
jgi:hypothetical protein